MDAVGMVPGPRIEGPAGGKGWGKEVLSKGAVTHGSWPLAFGGETGCGGLVTKSAGPGSPAPASWGAVCLCF